MAATHVGPRIETRITDQPDAIKYTGVASVKTYPRHFTKYRPERTFIFIFFFSFLFLRLTSKKDAGRDLTFVVFLFQGRFLKIIKQSETKPPRETTSISIISVFVIFLNFAKTWTFRDCGLSERTTIQCKKDRIVCT